MARVSLAMAALTATLLVFVGMHGCDSFVIFETLICPYYDSHTKHDKKPSCNATTQCSNGGECCTLEYGAAKCIPRVELCPNVVVNKTGCSKEAKKLECTKSTSCGSKGSCCLNTCGGTRCLDKDKSGKCPPVNTTPRACPLELITFSGTCTSDTNCAGKLKCCPQYCRSADCISV
jgi:hypothetical protein